MFHVYVDWTTESEPRPFYVGQGNDDRVRYIPRNMKHGNVAAKHGLARQIVASSDDHESIKALEVQLIAEHHTFVDDPQFNGIGCNYTLGGDGVSTHSSEALEKIRQARSVQPRLTHTDKAKQRISNARKGMKFSDEHRARLREARAKWKPSAEHRAKISEGMKRYRQQEREGAS